MLDDGIMFSSKKHISRPKLKDKILYGSHSSSLVEKNLRKKIQMIDIVSVHSRRFNMSEIAFEVFSNNCKGYYFNAFTP